MCNLKGPKKKKFKKLQLFYTEDFKVWYTTALYLGQLLIPAHSG